MQTFDDTIMDFSKTWWKSSKNPSTFLRQKPRSEASNDNIKTAKEVVEIEISIVMLLTRGIEKVVQGADSCTSKGILKRDRRWSGYIDNPLSWRAFSTYPTVLNFKTFWNMPTPIRSMPSAKWPWFFCRAEFPSNRHQYVNSKESHREAGPQKALRQPCPTASIHMQYLKQGLPFTHRSTQPWSPMLQPSTQLGCLTHGRPWPTEAYLYQQHVCFCNPCAMRALNHISKSTHKKLEWPWTACMIA